MSSDLGHAVMGGDPALTVQVAELAGYAVATATGSIDVTTHIVLDKQLDRALELTQVAVIVDLSAVDFCDSIGLNSFVQARRKATARGVILVTAGLRQQVGHVFDVTRLDEAFHSQPDLDNAVRWLETGTTGPAPPRLRAPHGAEPGRSPGPAPG